MKLAFFTGARSEYGIIRKLVLSVIEDNFFDVSIIVSGLHLLKEYGYTVTEIEKDNMPISFKISIYNENKKPDYCDFSSAINKFSTHLNEVQYDAVFVVGDRFEAYAFALAAHFTNTPIIHSGGGTITQGAMDNIYRYNITNLSTYHFATSEGNFKRLLSIPIINKENTYFTGSVAIDSITDFLSKRHNSIEDAIPGIKRDKYVLITFHSVTNSFEPTDLLLKFSVDLIIENGHQVLITFPNNDPGADKIIDVIESFINIPNVFVVKSLGALDYYKAMFDCKFLLGNSSSGIIEAAYFNKFVINVGARQEGREKDANVIDVDPDFIQLEKSIVLLLEKDLYKPKNNKIYGDGNSILKIIKILKNKFK